MVVVKQKTQVVQRFHGECPTHSQTDVSVRDVQVTIDEPRERGGTNLGLAPTETLVAALIACTNVVGHKCAAKHGVHLSGLTVDAEMTLDRRGVMLLEEVEVPFPTIRLTITARTDAAADAVGRMQADLRRFCPIAKVLRAAGTEVAEVWQIERA